MVNTTFFDEINTSIKAYWLGFLLADGSVFYKPKNGTYGFCIGLQHRDIEHVQKLEFDLYGTRQPSIEKNGVRLSWYSKHLAQSLIKLGVTPNKSGREIVPEVPQEYMPDFWRGYYDGDGCISRQIKHVEKLPEFRFSLCGSLELLHRFQKWAMQCSQMNPQKIVRAKNQNGTANVHVFYMCGNRQIERVLNAMYYDNHERSLIRKLALFKQLQEQNAREKYKTIACVSKY